MNTITTQEVTAMTVVQRAATALESSSIEKQLTDLAESTKDIVVVTNKDGREQCHRAYMVAREKRVSVEKLGKAARDDANNFSKAVVAEESRLVALIEPEELRLKTLRDAWDTKEAEEKAAKKAAEEARVATIKAKIQRFEALVMGAALKQFSADVKQILAEVDSTEIDDSFEEFVGEAREARGAAKQTLTAIITAKETAEKIAAEAAEQNRKMAEQLAELQRQNAELAKNQAPKPEEQKPEPPQEAKVAELVATADAKPTKAVDSLVEHAFGGSARPDPVIQAESVVASFLSSREWKSAAERNHARAICIEFAKFQAGYREAA